MNCLIIDNPHHELPGALDRFLQEKGVDTVRFCDPWMAVQKAQEQHFDLILLDAQTPGMRIDSTIRLLKGCDPQARIIVRTDENSRHLEAQVRNERVYYYHVDSFGDQELLLAISAALGVIGHSPVREL
ncbi:MAG TPA: response regulator [bacterium]|nr:response regulator [bacterium]HPN34310.1 response regulator [bacterium]